MDRTVTERAYELGWKEARIRFARQSGPAGLVAAARTIDLSSAAERARERRRASKRDWQRDAWSYYDALDVIKEGARFKGRSLSKLRLYPAQRVPGDPTPVPLNATEQPERWRQLCAETLERLTGGADYQATLLERWGQNGFVAGEAFLVRYTEDGEERTHLASVDELIVTDSGWALQFEPGSVNDAMRLDPATSLTVRIWYQHARYSALADSPVAGVLDHCEHLLQLQNEAMGVSLSRMNNGLLIVPKSALVGRGHVDDAGDGESQRNPTIDDLQQHIVAGIENPRSASVAAPVIIAVEPEDAGSFRHLTLERSFDRLSDERQKALIHRIATGVDLTTEILTGQLGSSTHWNLWALDDQQFRWYVEPDAITFLQALVLGAYRPALIAAGMPPALVDQQTIWFDAALLVHDPDESETVFAAHDRLLISDAAARRRIGFAESEAPDAEELSRRQKRDSEPPEPESEPDTGGDSGAITGSARTEQLGERWVARDRMLRTRLLAAADAAMTRALERAGAKLRSRFSRGSWASVIDGAANRDVASLLGPGAVTAAGIDPDQLIDGMFTDLADQFAVLVSRVQGTVRVDLARLGLDDDDLEEMERTQAADRDRAAALLIVLLAGLARTKLFDPSPTAPPVGEADTALMVPPGVIREVLSVAGGATGTAGPGGAIRSPVDDSVAGGVATGATTLAFAQRAGIGVMGWVWSYGDPAARTHPFDPHQRLDGAAFESWTDPQLANAESFPPEPFYFPGDHPGCQCDAVPIIGPAELATQD